MGFDFHHRNSSIFALISHKNNLNICYKDARYNTYRTTTLLVSLYGEGMGKSNR